MKTVIRSIAICVCLAVAIGAFAGCGNNQPEKVYDPMHDPNQHIDLYEKLTSLYGTERMAALEALGYSFEDTNVVHGFTIGIPEQVEYAGVTFDVYLYFDNDARLSGVSCTKKYTYPAEEEQVIKDILALGQQLKQDLGEPDETDGWNDYYEEEYDTEMDPDPPSYLSEAEIRKLIEYNQGGGLAWWDVTGYACQTAREYKTERFGDEAKCGFSLNFMPYISDYNETNEIEIDLSF